MKRAAILTTAALAAAASIPAGAARAASMSAWQPEPATYGVSSQVDVPVTMSDGTVLRVNIDYPADASGKPAAGPFPVLLMQTPYGKGQGNGSGGGELYLVQRGYIEVVADVRGTGDSQGVFNWSDPIEAKDGAALVRWAAALPHSDHRVGLFGSSYGGVIQIFTAGEVGRGSPLKTIFPFIAGNDNYRDVVFDGGIQDSSSDLLDLGITGATNNANPVADANAGIDPNAETKLLWQRAQSDLSYQVGAPAGTETGGDSGYDMSYWQARRPRSYLPAMVRNGVSMYLVGGWYDLYQRGEPLNYTGTQNLVDGRSVSAPMLPDQPVSPNYQLAEGPYYHLNAPVTTAQVVQLAWFDHWLKGMDTGITSTHAPLHLYELGAGQWVDTTTWPVPGTVVHTYWLGPGTPGTDAPSTNNGTLTSARPASSAGSDTVAWTGASSPCSRATNQWSFGAVSLLTTSSPCDTDDRSTQAGPGSLTYTTPAFTSPNVIAGPIDATLYATSTAPDTEFVLRLDDIAPDGSSTSLTTGALLGSFRALDRSQSWYLHGSLIEPYHDYTRASVRAVPTGKVVRYDVELFPTLAELATGHRLRLTIQTSDTPHLIPTPLQASGLAGGVYAIQRSAAAASYVNVPVAPQTAFAPSHCPVCQ